MSRIFHPCYLVPNFHVPHFPPLSFSVIWCHIFMSRIFMFRIFSVPSTPPSSAGQNGTGSDRSDETRRRPTVQGCLNSIIGLRKSSPLGSHLYNQRILVLIPLREKLYVSEVYFTNFSSFDRTVFIGIFRDFSQLSRLTTPSTIYRLEAATKMWPIESTFKDTKFISYSHVITCNIGGETA